MLILDDDGSTSFGVFLRDVLDGVSLSGCVLLLLGDGCSSWLCYIIILILQLSVCESMTGRSTEPFDLRDKVLFLCIVGLGRYNRQPNDSPAMELAAD